jgi:hypothetical protein
MQLIEQIQFCYEFSKFMNLNPERGHDNREYKFVSIPTKNKGNIFVHVMNKHEKKKSLVMKIFLKKLKNIIQTILVLLSYL